MALYLALLSRGVVTVLLAAGLLTLLLFVSFDLDRPTRGFITIPATPLVALRASMELPPAAEAPADGAVEERYVAVAVLDASIVRTIMSRITATIARMIAAQIAVQKNSSIVR